MTSRQSFRRGAAPLLALVLPAAVLPILAGADVPARSHALACDGGRSALLVYAAANGDGAHGVRLEVDGARHALSPTRAASGVRFESADGRQALWEHQGEFTFSEDGQTRLTCRAADVPRRLVSGDRVYTIAESHPVGASLADFRIRLDAPGKLPREFSLRDRDPLDEAFTADLDGNGEPELYLVTRSAGSGSHANAIAVLPGADGALIGVMPPELAEEDFAPGGPFAGYGGHDRWSVEGTRLLREFPVQRDGAPNAAPGDGTRRVAYALVVGRGQPALLPLTAPDAPRAR